MAKEIRYEAFLRLETGTHSTRINQLEVTRDSKTLISVGQKSIRVWDVETKKPVRMLLGEIGAGADGDVQRIALSRDDKYVVALAWRYADDLQGDDSRETDVRVFELATGNLQARFRYQGTLHDVDFSPDGRYIALVGTPKRTMNCGYLELYHADDLLQGFGIMPAPIASEALYEHGSESPLPASVRFIPGAPDKTKDARFVVASWDRRATSSREYTGRLLWYSLSPSGSLTRSPASRETEGNLPPRSLAVSGDYVVVCGDTKELYCHDHTGKLIATVLSEAVPAGPAFSRDGRRLIVGQASDSAHVEVSVYDVALGQFRLNSTYHGHDAEVVAVTFLRDGTAVSAGGDQNAIHFWNPSHFEGETTGVIKGVGRVVHAVGIDAQEQIALGNYDDLRTDDGNIILQRVFRLQDMTIQALPLHEAAGFKRAQKRLGEQWLELKSLDGYPDLYMLPESRRLTNGSSAGWSDITTFGFTENKRIVFGTSDGGLRVMPRRSTGSYAPPRYLLAHTAAVLDHAASARWLVSAGADQIIRLWYLQDVERVPPKEAVPALNLFIGSDDEWVIWSKSGYYHASQRGDRRFGYHVNRGPDKEAVYFSSDRFIKTFFRPDIIQAIVTYGSEERALAEMAKQGHAVAPIEISESLPPIIELAEGGVIATKEKVRLAFTVAALNRKKPVTRVWVVRNEQFVWESSKPREKYKVALPLLPGRNRIKILAENANAKAPPVIVTLEGPRPPKSVRRQAGAKQTSPTRTAASRGTTSKVERSAENIILGNGKDVIPGNGILYLLAVGVSDLKRPRPDKGFQNLHFAHEDAIAIYNAFGKERLSGTLDKSVPLRNKAFRSVEARILLNEQATKIAILKAVDSICAKIRTRAKKKGSERDVLLVFLSGHGVRRTDIKTKEQELYFWNYDLNFDNTRRTGLSLIDLGRKITSVPADVILTTDACHSGMAGSDVVKGLDPNELAQRIYAINERGMYILNAARSGEVAMESGRKDIQHGIFTKSILEALSVDNEVSMLELIASVQQRVQYYTSREQTPVCRMYGDLLPLVVYQK